MDDAYFAVDDPSFVVRNQVPFGDETADFRRLHFEFDTGSETRALLLVGFWVKPTTTTTTTTTMRIDDVSVVKAENVAVDGTFLDGPSSWSTSGDATFCRESGDAPVCPGAPHTGATALELTGSPRGGAAAQSIRLEPYTRYRAGAWVRAARVVDGWFTVKAGEQPLAQRRYGGGHDRYEWITFDFNSGPPNTITDAGPASTVTVTIELRGSGASPTVYVDDVSVAKATPLEGNYGFLSDFRCAGDRGMSESLARSRIRTMVVRFHIRDFMFYDWFADYETPTAGERWTDPWFHATDRVYCKETIGWYIDEIHRNGGNAWAYVQAIGAERRSLARRPLPGFSPLRDDRGHWFHMFDEDSDVPAHPTYFLNAAWADHQVSVWAQAVADLGFDGIHWDTLGRIAGDAGAERAGVHEFLRTAAPQLARLGLMQTMNFVDMNWWDPSLLDVVAFLYAEVWRDGNRAQLEAAMTDARAHARGGVMAYYPRIKNDGTKGCPQDTGKEGCDKDPCCVRCDAEQTGIMLARWAEAPQHGLRYLVIGDGTARLITEYFAATAPLKPAAIAELAR